MGPSALSAVTSGGERVRCNSDTDGGTDKRPRGMRLDDEAQGTIPPAGQWSGQRGRADRLVARRRAVVIATAGLAMGGALALTAMWVWLAMSMSTLWWGLVVLVLIVSGIIGDTTARPVPPAGPWSNRRRR